MEKSLTLKVSENINAPVSEVWRALTDPELIKKYFFGTDCITDWKKDSPITFKGTWEGKTYEDKGNILDIEKNKFIRYNFWSSFSGTKDSPENYNNISYELSSEKEKTVITVTQEGIKNEEAKEHSSKNWKMVLDGMKHLLEKQKQSH